MAEYINRNLIEWYGCDFEDASCENRECSSCSHAECFQPQVMQIPTADVVERKKYDLLQSGYETLKHQLEKSWNRIDELDKLNGNMRDKIDKTIKEMKEEYDNFKYSDNKTLGASFGIRKAIDILEKNLGE